MYVGKSIYINLELEEVGLVTVSQSEGVLQVVSQLSDLSDISRESSINLGLSSLSRLGEGRGRGRGIASEESVIDRGSVNTSEGNLGRGGDDVSLVDTAEGDAVGGIGA